MLKYINEVKEKVSKSSENMIYPFRKVKTCDLHNSLGGSYEFVNMMKW